MLYETRLVLCDLLFWNICLIEKNNFFLYKRKFFCIHAHLTYIDGSVHWMVQYNTHFNNSLAAIPVLFAIVFSLEFLKIKYIYFNYFHMFPNTEMGKETFPRSDQFFSRPLWYQPVHPYNTFPRPKERKRERDGKGLIFGTEK